MAAFTLNALHFMGGVDTTFFFMGTKRVASDLINAAAAAWESGSATDGQFYQNLLDAMNNAGTVPVILPEPCPVVYGP